MRVFWPKTGLEREGGVAVGWRLRDTLCVAAIVEQWMEEYADIEGCEDCGPLEALATVKAAGEDLNSASLEHDTFGLVIYVDHGVPSYRSPVETVFYTPTGGRSALVVRRDDGRGGDELAKQDAYAPMANAPSAVNFDELVLRLNCAQKVQSAHRSAPISTPWRIHAARALIAVFLVAMLGFSFLPPPDHSGWVDAVPLWNTMRGFRWATLGLLAITFPPFLFVTARVFTAVDAAATYLLQTGLGRALGHSALVTQIARRLHQLAGYYDHHDLTASTPALTFALQMDMVFGYSAATCMSHLDPASLGAELSLLADPIIAALKWLDAWPVGLKLNTALSHFLCTNLGAALDQWKSHILPHLQHLVPPALVATQLTAYLSLTLALSLVRDVLSLLTMHLQLAHRILAVLCRWQLSALLGLWDLFRGKRWNVLRHRTDSHGYDVDTLFLGTLLFTLAAFLAPTVLAYGALFALINAGIRVVQTILAAAVGALNTVPFEALTRLAVPQCVPGGITIDIVPLKNGNGVHALELKSTPKGFGAILGDWAARVRAELRPNLSRPPHTLQ